MRTKIVNIAGKDYWLAFSAMSKMNMEAIRRQPDWNPQTHGAEFALEMLWEELRAGYGWASLNGRICNEPPKKEDLFDLIGEDDMMDLMADINAVAIGDRNVEAKPPKKEPAGESDD